MALANLELATSARDGRAVPQLMFYRQPPVVFHRHSSSNACRCTKMMNLRDGSSTVVALFFQACCSSTQLAYGGKHGVKDFGRCITSQILKVNPRKVNLRFRFRCPDMKPPYFLSFMAAICESGIDLDLMFKQDPTLTDLPDGQRQPVIWTLGLFIGGVYLIDSMHFFATLGTRPVERHSEDGVSRPFGLIHRWQVRELSLLIPRCDGRRKFKLSSVMHPTDLQLSFPQPLVHMPARLSGESLLYGWLALSRPLKTSAVVVRQNSQLARHQTPVVVFPVFGMFIAVIVTMLCNEVHVPALLSRAL